MAAARAIAASAKDTVVTSIEVISKGVYRHQRLPSGRAALWPRVTERTTSCVYTGEFISCDTIHGMDIDVLNGDVHTRGTAMGIKNIVILDVPLTQEDEELHCPAMPTVINWDQ